MGQGDWATVDYERGELLGELVGELAPIDHYTDQVYPRYMGN